MNTVDSNGFVSTYSSLTKCICYRNMYIYLYREVDKGTHFEYELKIREGKLVKTFRYSLRHKANLHFLVNILANIVIQGYMEQAPCVHPSKPYSEHVYNMMKKYGSFHYFLGCF